MTSLPLIIEGKTAQLDAVKVDLAE